MRSDDETRLQLRRPVAKRQACGTAKTRGAKRARIIPPSLSEEEEDDKNDEDCPLVPLKAPPKNKPNTAKRCTASGPSPRQRSRKKAETDDEDDLTPDDGGKSTSRSFKEGQRVVCPPMGDPSRAFYESLIQEKPHSIIAVRWCVEHGVLIGSQHKSTLKYYKSLKAAGAFKPGQLGGLKTEFNSVFE